MADADSSHNTFYPPNSRLDGETDNSDGIQDATYVTYVCPSYTTLLIGLPTSAPVYPSTFPPPDLISQLLPLILRLAHCLVNTPPNFDSFLQQFH